MWQSPELEFPWHFDTNDFAVTVLLAEADEGGILEYVPDIHSGHEENYDAVALAQQERHSGVVSFAVRPGDMQIVRGRHSLHRVTRMGEGSRSRYTAIFAHTASPGVIGRLERTRQLFGRALPAHVEAERARVREDSLRD